MKNINRATVKKIELVPLIDVIFLLLIFFLVTLNIIPVLSKREMLESQFPVKVVTANDAAKVDMLIQMHQFPGDQKVHYFTIDAELEGIPIVKGTWEKIIELSKNKNNLPALKNRFKKHHFENPKKINFKGKQEVIISAHPWIPYEHLQAVIQECIKNGIHFYCNIGTFDDLPDKVIYPKPRGFVHRYDW